MENGKNFTTNKLLMITAFILLFISVYFLANPFKPNSLNVTQLPNITELNTYPKVNLDGQVKVNNGIDGRYFDSNGTFNQNERLNPNSTYKVNSAYLVNGHYYYDIGGQKYVIDNDVAYQNN